MPRSAPILEAVSASTDPWSLYALVGSRYVSLANGSGAGCVDGTPRHFLALAPPATGGIVIRRDPTCIVISNGRGTSLLPFDRRRSWDFTRDWEDVSLLWSLQDRELMAPDAEELGLRYYLWSSLLQRKHVPADASVHAAMAKDFQTLAAIAGCDLVERFTARAIWQVAHRAGQVREPPPGNVTETQLMQAVSWAIPPRWAMAEVLKTDGWDEEADLLMGSGSQ